MARDVPGSAAYFAGYEAVRRTMIPIGGTANDLNPLQLLFAGGKYETTCDRNLKCSTSANSRGVV